MEQEIKMYIDMTKEPDSRLIATLHESYKPCINIHGFDCPATISLTPDQAFHLFVELKSALKKVQLSLKKRR